MFPGMDKRAVEAAMKKLGVRQQQVEADEVIIRLKGGGSEIVVKNPSVTQVSMMGQETFQIAGDFEERPRQQQLFNDSDVKTVIEQANVSEAEAKAALAKVNGDLAAAIMLINEKSN
ncbi:nascent polypeptide-associated complex protein [Candidatus Woesearchaeota archaeon]|nr:nascent polypeptide-associated complex protein [Candidatus Woesearchaeota archaeon]